MMTVSDGEQRQILVALSIAIAHESQVISRLEQDPLVPFHREAIADRGEQIEKFERLAEKLRKLGS
jgi:hypothetical protein